MKVQLIFLLYPASNLCQIQILIQDTKVISLLGYQYYIGAATNQFMNEWGYQGIMEAFAQRSLPLFMVNCSNTTHSFPILLPKFPFLCSVMIHDDCHDGILQSDLIE